MNIFVCDVCGKKYKTKGWITRHKNKEHNNNNNNNNSITKPFLKWVGGKSQIINEILDECPNNINDYHELFLGGGSVLLAILSSKRVNIIGKSYAYDINPQVINVFKIIQDDDKLRELCDELSKITDKYNNIQTMSEKSKYYYDMRKDFNKHKRIICGEMTVIGAALFIFINKTCFRGLYRENSSGYFNTPFGNYVRPKFPTITELEAVNRLIKNTVFSVKSSKDVLDGTLSFNDGDFIYLDPPYIKETSTSFTKYTAGDFNIDEHKFMNSFLSETNCRFLLSNSNSSVITDTFGDKKYKISKITCRRSINSKKPDMTADEVLVSNIR